MIAGLTFIAISKAQSLKVNHAMRSNRIEGFSLSSRFKITWGPKYCQTTISVDTHQIFPKVAYIIVAINVDTTLIRFLLYM